MTAQKQPQPESPVYNLQPDQLPDPLLVIGSNWKIEAANQAALKLLGYSKKGLVGWSLEKFVTALPAKLKAVMAGKKDFAKCDVRFRMHSGKRALLSISSVPRREQQRVIGLICSARDVRVRRLHESEVTKARDYFRAIVHNSPYGICVTNLKRKVMMTNKTAEELIGYTQDELIGRPVMDFYPRGEKVSSLDLDQLRQDRLDSRQLRFRHPDGEEIPVLVSYGLIEKFGGLDDVIIESYSDQRDRLKLDQLKNEFVFVAAHELRNPVTAIKLLMDIIFDDKRITIDPILREYLAKMGEANERLLNLVDDLLEVSRTEAGRLKIKVSPQGLADQVNGLLNEIRPSAVAKGVTIRYEKPPRPITVLADTDKLKEVLSNLVSNAIKYNVPGGKITVSHEVEGQKVITHVKDSGIGITEEEMPKLFSKFWRSEDVAVRAQGGTGLGLFIVKELVNRMDGQVWAQSARGEGSIFSFSLPLVKGKKKKK